MAWMGVLTWLGDHRWVVAAAILIVWWGRRRRELWAAGAGVALALIIAAVLKVAFHRPRPDEAMAGLFVAHPGIGPSFPSGHATAAFALAALLSVGWRRWRGLWWTLAAGVAWSRLYLGLHYPSDCVAGALLGAGAVFGTVWVVRSAQPK
ncbi:MAG: hypothetical protein A3C53_00800 [Omnitrophica WOR_2 bacterium RIFCSPHIGHO2_02_FULL_68_15]|nr:MAG: hypothetical protein A3C53_00800 [Omnitrophica WOR_2 bacterium RIFCSPHIGHO2_02_FULL_68_15]